MNAYQVSIHILANRLLAYLSKKVVQRSWAIQIPHREGLFPGSLQSVLRADITGPEHGEEQ